MESRSTSKIGGGAKFDFGSAGSPGLGELTAGYVAMPEHVHLLVSEPRTANLNLKCQTGEIRDLPGLKSEAWGTRHLCSFGRITAIRTPE